jgi:SCF-associated factor 1
VVQHDGERWQKLYRRLLTQSRVFTWGSHGYNRLGHSGHKVNLGNAPHFGGQRWINPFTHCGYPAEMDGSRELGIIADMQCGGWSTTLLTSKGRLYSVGIFDGLTIIHHYSTGRGLWPLNYPAGYSQPNNAHYYEPATAIRQFSSGRSHVLALADNGKIWSWYAIDKPAMQVKFLTIETQEFSTSETSGGYGKVRKVLAGWSQSSAYIQGTGIVMWTPVKRDEGETESEIDTMLVTDAMEVPKTNYQRPKGSERETEERHALGEEVGEVLTYILLEHFVVFATDIGKVFAARILASNRVEEIMELRALRNESGSTLDVQGAFRSFAIFKNGEVITAHQDYIEACWTSRTENPEQTNITGLRRIPALQHNDVISISFGDYHYLALHSNGKITSYGSECQNCGALGLGGDGVPEGFTRGIRYQGLRHDGRLLPHAYTNGRQVWFQPEKKKWLTYMMSGGCDPEESKERMRMFMTEASVQGEVSEWFEQEGRDWDKDPELQDADDDGLGAHFVLSLSAAGWHSGAIVLVNDALEERVREKCIIKDTKSEEDEETAASPAEGSGQPLNVGGSRLERALNRTRNGGESTFDQSHGASPGKGLKYIWADKPFPRLRLSDGREMPGTVEFSEWKHERPDWQLDIEL